MDRRKFIFGTGAGMIALTLLGKNNYVFGSSNKIADRGACLPTTADILGPFYLANAPFRSLLSPSGAAGTTLIFKGQVFDENCNPVPDAIVDVWHADNGGAYDNSSPSMNYRGKFQTNIDGEYLFESIKPGWYLNGSQYRPAHIHFRVTAPGFTELITQLYFENDPYIPNDPWASDDSAELRIVPVAQENGTDTAIFNIYLDSASLDIKPDKSENFRINIEKNPFNNSLTIISEELLINNVELFSSNGTLVATRYDTAEKRVSIDTRALASGLYFVRINTGENILVHQVIKKQVD